ncbi:UAA transporter [Tothia fuscella]|uniref:UAA transporter n=1 Tax=Tothia fuscella TaxID=1048955 RepID=A0A9P4P4A3_9PEZI|nr:UAA transporter [Tothia fuscella]
MLESLAPLGVSALIFGGCCSNVYALEAILKHEPDSGLLITLMQFIIVALSAYPTQSKSGSLLKRPNIPFRKLAASAAMFYAVNMLNNWAFAFDISVPVHIILRSFGSVTTMAAGWIRGKKYSLLQVLSVVVLTVGVIISAWADALMKGKNLDAKITTTTGQSFEMGLMVLLVAQVLSSFMGVYVQDIYADHGKHWDENLFYSHFLSLPMFLPLLPTLRTQFIRLQQSPQFIPPQALSSSIPHWLIKNLPHTPRSVYMLFLNSITQLACITGVNLLGANSSAVTVTIVLNVRKLVSWILSIWMFGNRLSGMMVVGAVLVFGSGALYGWETNIGIKRRERREVAGSKEDGVTMNGTGGREKEL